MTTNSRRERLARRTRSRMTDEVAQWTETLSSRQDFTPKLAPFVRALALTLDPAAFIRESPHPTVFTLCVQAPLELFRAAGVRPFRLACGAHAAGDMAPTHLPALTCPMMRSVFGLVRLNEEAPRSFVIPFTCDWVVKFGQLAGLAGDDIHFMELPHLREGEAASRQWIRETAGLKHHLEALTGKKIGPKQVLAAVRAYAKAWALFVRLDGLRQAGSLSCIHFALAANALPYMDIGEWTKAAQALLAGPEGEGTQASGAPAVFLTGSPIVFPNFKLLDLMERAGLRVADDDLCTMGRVIPGATVFEDASEYALVRALGERHHQGCTCPTFADNERRLNRLVNALETKGIPGVVFHVLKGCHPFDMEAGILERDLKKRGVRFLKIETDYVKEDEQNILTRLEAFSRTLNSRTLTLERRK